MSDRFDVIEATGADMPPALEVIKIAADRWVIYAADHDEPLGVVDQLEALEPAGVSLFAAVLADGLEVGIYRSLAGALAALEAAQ